MSKRKLVRLQHPHSRDLQLFAESFVMSAISWPNAAYQGHVAPRGPAGISPPGVAYRAPTVPGAHSVRPGIMAAAYPNPHAAGSTRGPSPMLAAALIPGGVPPNHMSPGGARPQHCNFTQQNVQQPHPKGQNLYAGKGKGKAKTGITGPGAKKTTLKYSHSYTTMEKVPAERKGEMLRAADKTRFNRFATSEMTVEDMDCCLAMIGIWPDSKLRTWIIEDQLEEVTLEYANRGYPMQHKSLQDIRDEILPQMHERRPLYSLNIKEELGLQYLQNYAGDVFWLDGASTWSLDLDSAMRHNFLVFNDLPTAP